MKNIYLLKEMKVFISVTLLTVFSFSAFGQISGTVFRDFNGNGTKQTGSTFNEIGAGGIIVNAYDSNNNLIATQITSSVSSTQGEYTFPSSGTNSIASGTPVRLEFIIDLSGDYATVAGGTTVQFVTAPATNINLGINYRKDFLTNSNPKVSIPIYCGGSNSPGTFSGQHVYVSYPWSNSGTTNPSMDVTNAQIGAVWGSAYQRSSKFMFASSILKRHCDFGSGGLGGIYKMDYNSANPGTSLFIDLDAAPYSLNLGTFNESDVSRGLSTSDPASIDADAFGKVGKMGLGGLTISDDETVLYSINLFEKKLIKIEIGNPATVPASSNVTQYSLPDPGCTNGVTRPWAVEFYRGLVYVGLVCSAETGGTKANLSAYVYTFDPVTNTFSGPLSGFPVALNYPKGGAHASESPLGDSWNPWSDNPNNHPKSSDGYYVRYPQPILSDIDFTPSGYMVLSFIDRAGHQWGFWNFRPDGSDLIANNVGGDILMFWKNGASWQMESNAVAGSITGCGAGNGEGPGNGEFFCNEKYATDHEETSFGSGVVNSALNTIKTAVMDPITYDSGGTTDFSLSNGNATLDYQLYQSVSPYITFGKAAGLGELELIDTAPPLEIGNRVWNDTNSNGIQDAGESGISGVSVQLYNAAGSTLISSATTDANGNYIFSNGSGTTTSAFRYGLTALVPNTAYIIRVPTSTGGLTLTTANAGSKNTIDSDAPSNGDVPVLATEIPMAGANNHTFDIGYSPLTCSLTSAGKTNEACNNNGTASNGADDYVTFSLNPTGTGLGTGYTVTVSGAATVTPSSGTYGSATNFQLQNGSANGTLYTITVTDNASGTCTVTTTVQQSSCSAPCPEQRCGTASVKKL